MSRNLYLFGEVNSSSVQNIIRSIHQYNAEDYDSKMTIEASGGTFNPQPIRLYINSWGGSLWPGISLINIIETSITPIHTYCLGTAYSITFAIFVTGQKRFAYKHSKFMYHSVTYNFNGDGDIPLNSLKNTYDDLESCQSTLDQIVLTYTNFDRDFLNNIVDKKDDFYFDYNYAGHMGVIDEVLLCDKYTADIETVNGLDNTQKV